MIRGVIFDLDGTLLDTLKSLADAFNRSLDKMGFPPHPIQDYRYFIGDGVFRCAERCLPPDARTQDNINTLVDIEREDYGRNWQAGTTPYPGMQALLDALIEREIPVAALTNKDQPFANDCVNHFFPDTAFTHVIGFSETTPHKPDPTGARRVLSAWGLAPEAVALVGDTAVDMATALACNVHGVGVLWGFRDAAELEDAGAAHLIEHPLELLPLTGDKHVRS